MLRVCAAGDAALAPAIVQGTPVMLMYNILPFCCSQSASFNIHSYMQREWGLFVP